MLVRRQLQRLNASDQEVLLLHYYAGKSMREIAVMLDISREAAKKRLQRARESLYAEMLDRGMLDEEQSRHYVKTLHREADRLSHLVENGSLEKLVSVVPSLVPTMIVSHAENDVGKFPSMRGSKGDGERNDGVRNDGERS